MEPFLISAAKLECDFATDEKEKRPALLSQTKQA